MGRKPWFAIALLVLGLAVGAASTVPFSRASETAARVESHLAKAGQLAREADTVKETDPARYGELTQESRKWAGFAETDQQEHSSQRTGAWIMATGAFGLLAMGALMLMITRRGVTHRTDDRQPQHR
jgi:hypothetical protein